MMATIPFVVFGLFRYLMLMHREDLGEEPESVLLSDVPILATIALWALTSALILGLTECPPGNARWLLARDHAAPEPTLLLTKVFRLWLVRVRPLAWCSRPRRAAASPEGALAVGGAAVLRVFDPVDDRSAALGDTSLDAGEPLVYTLPA
jgi:hypothetical protein